MTITKAQLQALIIVQCGGDTPANTLATNLPLIWDMYEGEAGGIPQLVFLYAKRDALDTLIGYYKGLTDYRSGDQMVYRHQQVVALTNLRNQVQAQINDKIKAYRLIRPPAQGTITRTAPITSGDLPETVGYPDPSGRTYRGDPLVPISRKGLIQ